ncbi:Rid family hydrolase [Blastomonas fulva]|jgi:2-iminobutanoate/2-iminopropanoate deaminase|uniref:Rid family hydrolase n=1 Tax=Blastomonas fulva TaxID=1550728 RepID=UPI0025A47E02|nr:Rid family hydrolase [Blastomonas fulva]MDM7928834.1 Rid family hydrolase [Blastomonas fulva]MDM7964620.1 Rid family hydrolase [Blastomonas fulva]
MTHNLADRRRVLTGMAGAVGAAAIITTNGHAQESNGVVTGGQFPPDGEITKFSTGGYYEINHNYSRAVVLDNWIFMSNTAGVDPQTGKFPSDPVQQARFAIEKVEKSLAELGSGLADVVRYVAHVPNRGDIFPVMNFVSSRFEGIDPAVTLLCTPLGSDDYKVELEVTAYRTSGKRKQKRLLKRL